MPVNNYYPTNWWASGESIEDVHALQLKTDLPGGQYRIALGLYRLADGTRLPVIDATGKSAIDAQYILPDAITIGR